MGINTEEFFKSINGKGFLGNRGRFNKGPEGLGDPDDKTLTEIEKKVVIPSYARDLVIRKYCNIENQEYEKCKNNTWFYNRFYICSEHKHILNSCVESWLSKLDLAEEATAEYLEDRRLFRITGLNRQEREKLQSSLEIKSKKLVNKIRSFLLNEEEMQQYENNKKQKSKGVEEH